MLSKLSQSYFHGFVSVQHAVSLPPSETLRKLFPRFPLRPACCIAPSHAVSVPPSEALRKLYPRYPIRPACCLAPSQQSSSQAISTVSSPSSMLYPFSQRSFPQAISTVSHPSSMLSRSLPAKLSASYFHGFLSVQHAVSLPPSSEALRKLFARFPLRPACRLAPRILSRTFPAKLSPQALHGFLSVQHAVSLPPSEALRNLFPWFPIRPTCCLVPSQRSSPQANLHGFLSVQHAVSLPPSEISASYFHGFLSIQHAVSLLPSKLTASYVHGFPSVQHAVSLHSSEALRKLFARFPLRQHAVSLPPSEISASYLHGFLSVQHAVSLPPKLFARFPLRPACCLAPRMLSRTFPAKLSASYLHAFPSVQHAASLRSSEALRKLFAPFPIRPACCLAPFQRNLLKLFARFASRPACCLAPSQRSSPVQHAVSLLPREALRKLFPWFPVRPACCLAPSQQAHCKLCARFPSVQHAVSLPSSEALRKLSAQFPLRPACCLAPSQRTSPQTISTVSYPSSMLSRSLPAKLSASYFPGLHPVQHAVSLPPSEALRKLFAQFPLRPACCLAPSQRSSPQAISMVSCPSSMLSRSLPAAKLSASYVHGFPSVQHAVSLTSSEALRKLFAQFPLRPACCLALSQRNLRKLFARSSMLSRSPPAKLSASYFHGFLSVQDAVSFPPSEALRKLFPQLPIRPACCLASFQRSSPQAICTVSYPSSMLSRSLPAKLSASYLHSFLSVQHAPSFPPSEALRKLFARFPLRPACCLAPSQQSSSRAICTLSSPSSMLSRSPQRSSPQAICTASSPSSMLSRSLPAKLSASYLHGFLSVQHAVSLPLSEALRNLFPRFPIRPACCLALALFFLPPFLSASRL